MNIEKLLTFNEAIEILKWKKTKGYEMFKRKDFPAFKDGKTWKIKQNDLVDWIDKQRLKA